MNKIIENIYKILVSTPDDMEKAKALYKAGYHLAPLAQAELKVLTQEKILDLLSDYYKKFPSEEDRCSGGNMGSLLEKTAQAQLEADRGGKRNEHSKKTYTVSTSATHRI